LSLDRERLERLLGGAAGARLRRRLRERLVHGAAGAITLTRATDAERRVVERLLGRPPRRGQRLRIDPDDVAATLRQAGIAPDLRSALESLDGPLRNPAAERTAEAARWQRVFDAVAERAAALGVSPWLEYLSATGVLKRLSGGDPAYAGALLTASLDVIDELPAQGLTRSTLAARVLGDAHGLDRGAPVAALVRQVLRHYWRGGIADPTTDARTLWAHAGVRLGGDINSTVLAYQLPVAAHDTNGGAIAAANTAAEPVYLTLRQLLRHPPAWAVGGVAVFVCENPSVIAEAAEQRGGACAPLVATQGRPQTAAWVLLEQLRAAGATLYARADLDWTGVRILNGLHRRLAVTPWRMDATTLRRYAHCSGSALNGRAVEAAWDPELASALHQRGQALEEEQLLDDLLNDLAAAAISRNEPSQSGAREWR
jgi:uncharacterized protein (TIGR02679 family)